MGSPPGRGYDTAQSLDSDRSPIWATPDIGDGDVADGDMADLGMPSFEALDRNRDGVIDREEYTQYAHSKRGFNPARTLDGSAVHLSCGQGDAEAIQLEFMGALHEPPHPATGAPLLQPDSVAAVLSCLPVPRPSLPVAADLSASHTPQASSQASPSPSSLTLTLTLTLTDPHRHPYLRP